MSAQGLELKIPPVAVVLLIAGLMGAAARALPRFTFHFPGRAYVAGALAAAGLLVSFLGVVAFRRARTTVNPMSPESASSLVIAGIYRRTRNPMYLGFLGVLLGLAVFLSNAVAALLVPIYVLYMTRFQIRPEERALEARFGADFVAYKGQVRRWV
jgi:protein-S-isoprenylcysteine O-methyltransferase Ste14